MSEELLIAQCAPTLADLKTGSLFTCPVDDPARAGRYSGECFPEAVPDRRPGR